MSTDTPQPADIIAEALSRLRGRGPGGRGGRRGGREADRIGPLHEHPHHHAAHHAHDAHTTHEHPLHEPPGPHATIPAAPHLGGPAWMRLLDALASAPDPLSVSEIGDAIGVDQPRASRLVQQAVEREFVIREADPADARRTRIALSDTGRTMATGVRGQRRKALSAALGAFTDTERDDLARLLTKLADNWKV